MTRKRGKKQIASLKLGTGKAIVEAATDLDQEILLPLKSKPKAKPKTTLKKAPKKVLKKPSKKISKKAPPKAPPKTEGKRVLNEEVLDKNIAMLIRARIESRKLKDIDGKLSKEITEEMAYFKMKLFEGTMTTCEYKDIKSKQVDSDFFQDKFDDEEILELWKKGALVFSNKELLEYVESQRPDLDPKEYKKEVSYKKLIPKPRLQDGEEDG